MLNETSENNSRYFDDNYFILLMGNEVTGVFPHEILGIAVVVLFIIHQILNRSFYKNLFKGKYTKKCI